MSATPPAKSPKPVSGLTVISGFPRHPLSLLKEILKQYGEQTIYMNLATIDKELGVLNRTVNFRGIVDKSVAYTTARSARNYKNLMANPKCALTILFPPLTKKDDDNVVTWQVRLIGAVAKELSKTNLQNFWEAEPIFSKIRYTMGNTGAPVKPEDNKKEHDAVLTNFDMSCNNLEMVKNYTGFKIDACRWDFYKSETMKIADRLHYVKDSINEDKWMDYHVAP